MARKFIYDIREFQLRILEILKVVDRVCHEHGLHYTIIDGTLLGAVRHKGFIPWDDDIDLGMPRKDYDLFVEHAAEWLPEPFELLNYQTNPDYPRFFCKVCDNSTTIVERFFMGYACGINLDIFPLDKVPGSGPQLYWHYYRFKFLRQMLYFLYRDPYKRGRGVRSWWPRLLRWMLDRQKIHRWTEQVMCEYEGRNNLDHYLTHDDGMRPVPKTWFDHPDTLDFEGMKVPVPSDPDAFLQLMYGKDYMQLPPEQKRKAHYHEYCNFDQPLRTVSFEQLKRDFEAQQPSS